MKMKEQSTTSAAVTVGLSAALAGILTDVIFYGLDSYKVMLQAGEHVKVSKLFRGALPVAIMGSGPSFGAFFICYNPIRNVLNERLGPGQESISVLVASIIAGVPSSIVAVPADVVKKYILLDRSTNLQTKPASLLGISKHLVQSGGVSRLFLGWQANILKDVPFVGIKMSLYEGMARLYLQFKDKSETKKLLCEDGLTKTKICSSVNADALNSVEAAGVGFISGLLTAVLTCPIDCVNSRIKSGELANFDVLSAHVEIVRKDGVRALFRGVVPRGLILGLGSTLFWYLQATIFHMLPAGGDK